MRKILLLATIILLTSCYNTRILVGDVKPKEPVVEINSEWNHGLLWGLVPLNNATMKASEYVNNAENYVIKTNQSFVNMFVSYLTFGIYSPTQTKYYIPLKDIGNTPAQKIENKPRSIPQNRPDYYY